MYAHDVCIVSCSLAFAGHARKHATRESTMVYGLMQADGKAGESGGWDSKEELINELKNLAKELECVVVTAVHLNRQDEVRFMSVLNTADIVMILSMSDEDPYIPPIDGNPAVPGVLFAHVTRNRSGVNGVTLATEADFSKAGIRERADIAVSAYNPPKASKDDLGKRGTKSAREQKERKKPKKEYDGSQF